MDIQSFLSEMFDHSISPSTITELTKTFTQFRQAWFNSKLEKHYLAVFCDVVFVTVKRGNSYASCPIGQLEQVQLALEL